MYKVSSSLIAFSSLGRPASAASTLATAQLSSADTTTRLMSSSKLYPASIAPIALQNFLWTRTSLTLCPRGVAVGSIAQTLSILLAVPLVAVTQSKLADGPMRSFISVDWLHGIEQLLMAIPNHVMVSSFRQAVAAHENGKPLPVREISALASLHWRYCFSTTCPCIYLFTYLPPFLLFNLLVQCIMIY
mmetsp:Transcript_16324/g.46875  ORF Transcript_16324/g.46875 Transcript_16324/m.46875 type:complete len:189 (-) Transcript_16324:2030-2596(-)